jgi:hypothetical protein
MTVTYLVGDSSGDSPHKLTSGTRHWGNPIDRLQSSCFRSLRSTPLLTLRSVDLRHLVLALKWSETRPSPVDPQAVMASSAPFPLTPLDLNSPFPQGPHAHPAPLAHLHACQFAEVCVINPAAAEERATAAYRHSSKTGQRPPILAGSCSPALAASCLPIEPQALRRKIVAYMANGASLGWLLLPQCRTVVVWKAGAAETT